MQHNRRGGISARDERPSRQQPRTSRAPSRRAQKSVVQEVVSSSVFKQFARSAGREIVRGLFGAARRR